MSEWTAAVLFLAQHAGASAGVVPTLLVVAVPVAAAATLSDLQQQLELLASQVAAFPAEATQASDSSPPPDSASRVEL